MRSTANSPWKSPQKQSLLKHAVTLTIDDPERAPRDLQGATLTFLPDDKQLVVLRANSTTTSPNDLCTLTHLHEPAVVTCLKERYEQHNIYTYTGNILLALNPFRNIPDLYSDKMLETYRYPPTGTRMPHVYAVGQDAYYSMLRGMTMGSKGDQSILVSGESGAGKTVTTKLLMGFLATLSKESTQSSHTIESQVLQSNPILESFGNARTVRNDNSSRFGKFIEIRFDSAGSLVEAKIETYLLER
ncbi:MAG: hypothetical protein AAGJ35_16380, partial [Myxococcota bacterium]